MTPLEQFEAEVERHRKIRKINAEIDAIVGPYIEAYPQSPTKQIDVPAAEWHRLVCLARERDALTGVVPMVEPFFATIYGVPVHIVDPHETPRS
jgi:hypothetical protein